MSEERKYTAAEIEKYQKGQLSPAEMNALEKAALDDPFLAEAIEGYGTATVNATKDLNELKQRLSERIGNVSEKKGSLISMNWFRAAAIIIFLAGAGLLVYQFSFKKSENSVAKLEERSNQEAVKDSNTPANTENDSARVSEPAIVIDKKANIETASVNNGKASTRAKSEAKENLQALEPSGLIKTDDAKTEAKTIAPAPEKKEQRLDALARKEEKRKEDERNIAVNKDSDEVVVVTAYGMKRSVRNSQLPANNFRGRVTDLNNNPVPFANIIIPKDNTATYSDANGNFNLVSPDTVLDVKVRSVGYELNNARLRDARENQIILQGDRNSMSEVVINTAKPNTTRNSFAEKKKTARPEPSDGWENYDAYLLNNLQMPDELKKRNSTGQVEVSFEVNRSGRPVNIKIERSLCAQCDEEAIRLIKQGPKWGRTSKKDRAVVTVPFINYPQ